MKELPNSETFNQYVYDYGIDKATELFRLNPEQKD